jgi:hypothetical protein
MYSLGVLLTFSVFQAERLSEFYEICKSMYIGRGEKFIKIEQVCIHVCGVSGTYVFLDFSLLSMLINSFFFLIMKPPLSFLQTMEEYVRDAPRVTTALRDQVQKCSLRNGFVFEGRT